MHLPVTPSLRLDGRRALVTGAGRGIGLAIAAALSEAGAEVTLLARTGEDIATAAQAIRARGGSAASDVLDVTDLAAVRGFFARAPAYHILVNNVGMNRPKPIWEVTEDDYDAVMQTNLRSAFFVAQSAARRMMEERIPGSLIHIGSQMGHVGAANRSLYCASKWALEGLSKAIALELAPFRIRSNTIAPTFIETALTRPFLESESFKSEVLSKIKLGRLGQVEDVMGAALYLASDASAMMTGTAMVIDGGWTAD